MLRQLPESGAARERRSGGTLVSVAAHIAIITAAIAGPVRGTEAPTHEPIEDTTIIYAEDPTPRTPAPPDAGRAGPSVPNGPTIPQQPTYDLPGLPGPDVPTVSRATGDSAGIRDLLAGGPATPLIDASVGTVGEASADEPVRVRIESVPRYPEAMRALGVIGIVEMEFVVDSMGRADLASARVLASPHEAFTLAVRAALRDARFVPGRYRGHAVRTLVRRAYHFQVGDRR
jgi:TonB family protein